MKRPNITPGLWEVTDEYTALLHNDLREETVWEVNGRESGNSPAYATSEEHAYAIAALPDLLAALEHVKSRMENALNAGHCMRYADAVKGEASAFMEDYAIVRQALTKAGYTF